MNISQSLQTHADLANSQLGDITLAEKNGVFYVTESSILSYAKNNNIDSPKTIPSQLSKFYGIDSLIVIKESDVTDSLFPMYEMLSLLESIRAKEMIKTAEGPSVIKKIIVKIVSFIVSKLSKNTSQDTIETKYLEANIKLCDKVLKDIEDEKSKLRTGSKEVKTRVKMSCAFVGKSVLEFIKGIAGFTITGYLPSILGSVAATGVSLKVNANLYDSLKGFTLSIVNYRELLRFYEMKIRMVKDRLEEQLEKVKKKSSNTTDKNEKEIKKEMNLEEDSHFEDDDDVTIRYQTPEDLKIDREVPNVLHDDNDSMELNLNKDEYSDKTNPHSVGITKYGGKYYVNHSDLKCYMDMCDRTYESAIDDIINSYDIPELCKESVVIPINQREFDALDAETQSNIECSILNFEIKECGDSFCDDDYESSELFDNSIDSDDVFDDDDFDDDDF